MGQHALTRWPQRRQPAHAGVFSAKRHAHRSAPPRCCDRCQPPAPAARKNPHHPARPAGDANAQQRQHGRGRTRAGAALLPKACTCPAKASLDNRQLLAALAHEMEQLGVTVHWNCSKTRRRLPGQRRHQSLAARLHASVRLQGYAARRARRGDFASTHRRDAAAPNALGTSALPDLHRTWVRPRLRHRRDGD